MQGRPNADIVRIIQQQVGAAGTVPRGGAGGCSGTANARVENIDMVQAIARPGKHIDLDQVAPDESAYAGSIT